MIRIVCKLDPKFIKMASGFGYSIRSSGLRDVPRSYDTPMADSSQIVNDTMGWNPPGNSFSDVTGARGIDKQRLTNAQREQASRFGMDLDEYMNERSIMRNRAIREDNATHGKLGTAWGRFISRICGDYASYKEREELARARRIGARINDLLEHRQRLFEAENGISSNNTEYSGRYTEANKWRPVTVATSPVRWR